MIPHIVAKKAIGVYIIRYLEKEKKVLTHPLYTTKGCAEQTAPLLVKELTQTPIRRERFGVLYLEKEKKILTHPLYTTKGCAE